MLSVMQVLIDSTRKQGCNFHDRGTIIVIQGPRFSTKAESFMYQSFGASLVGMTAVPEVKRNNVIRNVYLSERFMDILPLCQFATWMFHYHLR